MPAVPEKAIAGAFEKAMPAALETAIAVVSETDLVTTAAFHLGIEETAASTASQPSRRPWHSTHSATSARDRVGV